MVAKVRKIGMWSLEDSQLVETNFCYISNEDINQKLSGEEE